MIKNIIFDFGGVLVDWNSQRFIASIFLFLRREGFLRNPQSLPRASSATQNEEVAGATLFFDLCTFPFNKLMSMCLYTKNEPYRTRSSFCVAEREGFEPPEPLSSTVFKTAAIDHSAISPRNRLQKYCFFFKYTNFLQKFLPICEKYSNFAPKIVQNVPTDTQIEDSPRDGD